MRVRSKKGVSHWIKGQNTWQLGLLGLCKKKSTIRILSYLSGIVWLTGKPFWLPDSVITLFAGIPEKIKSPVWIMEVNAKALVSLLLLLAAGIFFYIRKRSKKSLAIRAALHSFMHCSRDHVIRLLDGFDSSIGEVRKSMTTEINSEVMLNKQPYNENKNEWNLYKVSKELCEKIVDYFSVLLNDKNNIGCAIRIMSAESSKVKYVTFGRGGALDARRAQSTEPLSMDQGVPKFFLSDEVQCKGVLFYDDLKKAAKNGAYLWTRNDEKFHDIKTMAVVPINGWDGRKRSLIGLLYLTSKTNSILNVTHIDSMMFAGDQLALTYSSILAILDSCSLSYKPSSFWETDKHGNL